jgi:hypothetical protein
MHIQNRAICTGLQGESRDIIPWRTPRLIAGDRDGAELLKMTVHCGLGKCLGLRCRGKYVGAGYWYKFDRNVWESGACNFCHTIILCPFSLAVISCGFVDMSSEVPIVLDNGTGFVKVHCSHILSLSFSFMRLTPVFL